MTVPANPKIYHILHVDRLPSIIADGYLWCDAEIVRCSPAGTTIGMNTIKQRRLNELKLNTHTNLYVGQCVPFYFCPRSVMLYVIHQANHPELAYKDGQGPIIHLEADLNETVHWANQNGKRWAFTLSNAGSRFFEDYANLNQLDKIDWVAVQTIQWLQCKEGKQAEFLLEHSFPWQLVERVGVHSKIIYQKVASVLATTKNRPRVEIKQNWYY